MLSVIQLTSENGGSAIILNSGEELGELEILLMSASVGSLASFISIIVLVGFVVGTPAVTVAVFGILLLLPASALLANDLTGSDFFTADVDLRDADFPTGLGDPVLWPFPATFESGAFFMVQYNISKT